MAVKNCPICGKIFNCTLVNEVCADCVEKYEEDLRKIKYYLYENPSTSMVEVAEATGVTIEYIKVFLANERIYTTKK